jgi:predicted ATPase
MGGPPIPPGACERYRRAVPTPDALRATVLARLRRLDRAERTVIMRASVIGRHFAVRVAVAAAARPEAKVRLALERASSLQLVVQTGRDVYSFRHALTHDIVYAEFIGVRTRPLHHRIAKVLERTLHCGEPVLEELAYHAWAAGDAARTLRYNELLGDNAAAVHAYDDARRHYARARSVLEVGAPAFSRLTEKLRTVEAPA